MHTERIYLQDNFVPNYDVDPFRRRVVGIGIFLNEGDSYSDAIAKAEQEISDYIKDNTILPTGEMMGTHLSTISNPEQDEKLQQEFIELENKLRSFEFQEDANAYLETTSWKFAIAAKKIVQSLPLKNK